MRRLLILAALCAIAAATALPPFPTSAGQTEPWCPACSPAPASIAYEPNATGLPAQEKPILDGVIATMMASPGLRVILIGYARSTSEEAPAISQARRVRLSRTIAVRTYLIEHGVKSPRIDVRAMGTHWDGNGSPDRVDIVTLNQ